MAIYRVEFKRSAAKELHSLPIEVQRKIAEALTLLAMNPFSELLQIKKLKGADSLYRFRSGDYRVIYEVQREVLLVVVVKVGHRREVYR